MSLGVIWHMIPELCLDYPIPPGYPQPIWIDRPYNGRFAEYGERVFTLQASAEQMREDAAALRLLYPELEGAELLKFGGGSYSEMGDGTRTDEAVFRFHDAASVRRLRGDAVLMPALRPHGGSADPLLAWWVLLFTLSIVTRYEPVVWTRLIDVNRSPSAVAIEAALSKALTAVPIQIYTALTSE
ncbi:hypothetical protein GCM10011512_14130 [Tersicoccus solisilvae]|uniref:Uncharacterized protein n=1 Tax=Tersicoccus solisilvae TaxID=1882339 RepID=A0ABQ1P0K0_9MICC|nr:hypothetical protein GCM10011512_14130 [Tersicoccus solisilvae]